MAASPTFGVTADTIARRFPGMAGFTGAYALAVADWIARAAGDVEARLRAEGFDAVTIAADATTPLYAWAAEMIDLAAAAEVAASSIMGNSELAQRWDKQRADLANRLRAQPESLARDGQHDPEEQRGTARAVRLRGTAATIKERAGFWRQGRKF